MLGAIRNYFGLAAIAGLAFTGAVTAQQSEVIGQAEYLNSCAVCHGLDATGNGQLTEFMNIAVSDLTKIAQKNDGEFPFLQVIHIIDGRSGVRGHGTDMPIWGDRFAADAASEAEGDYSAALAVRGRILSLAYYLESIQAE